MKTSTEIASIAEHVGEHKAVELCAKAGFDGWDFSMFRMCRYDWRTDICHTTDHPLSGPNYLRFVKELKQIGLDNGIVCNQSHAPFPVMTSKIYPYLQRAIECTAEVGAQICVIHPDNHRTPEKNAEIYNELLPFAKSCGVKIATENMWNWHEGDEYSSFAACATADSFRRHLEAVNDEFMVACVDIGHAEMRGSGDGAANMIRVLGSKVQALHIHDNDRHHDNHQIPFSMDVDFDEIVKALKQIGYTGWLTLECGTYMDKCDKNDVFKAVCDMSNAVRRMANMF